jgi:hypothetical protein
MPGGFRTTRVGRSTFWKLDRGAAGSFAASPNAWTETKKKMGEARGVSTTRMTQAVVRGAESFGLGGGFAIWMTSSAQRFPTSSGEETISSFNESLENSE